MDSESKRQIQKHLTFISKQRHLKYIISISSLFDASHYLFEHILKSYYLSTLQTSTDSFLLYSLNNVLTNVNEVSYIRQCLIKYLSQNLYYNNQIQLLITLSNQVISSNSTIHSNSEIFHYLLNSHTILLRSYGKLLYNHLKQLLVYNNDNKLEDYLKKYISNDNDCIEIVLWSYYYTNVNEDMLLFQKLTPFIITYIYYVIDNSPIPLISIIILHNPSLFVNVFDILSNKKEIIESKNRLRLIIDCIIAMCQKNKNIYYKVILPQFKSLKSDDSILSDLIYSLSM